jgi:SAM-dependent methyltransferase
MLREYTKSASVYDANLKQFFDYPSACKKIHGFIQQHHSNAKTLLDVACGTGKHLEFLQEHYQVEGLDLSPQMLEIARNSCPQIPFHEGNMIDFDLSKKFDVITCLYASVAIVKTLDNVRKSIARMAEHLAHDGILLIEPWWSPEQLWEGKLMANFADEPEHKVACMYIIKREGRLSVFDVHYLVGTPQGIESFTEREEVGLFTREEYTESLENAGLEVCYYDTELFPEHKYGLYVGTKKNEN